ncbi:MAG: cell division protein FtsQ [Dysgonamonadaceae bacterium]|jgi:cell division protein FtsQ|nr:cell division protein FtsQ [Dysgonamonadaceae bacterium]
MIKKIVLITLALMLLIYILFAVFVLNPNTGDGVCKNLEVVVKDAPERHFVDGKEVAVMLRNAGLSPIGKKLTEIKVEAIEEKLRKNKLIKTAECYKTPEGNIKVEISQKTPVLRVFSTNGSFYVDSEGGIMPLPTSVFSAYVPVATGFITPEFATTRLYEFVLFLYNDKFWDTQIEQIYVASNQDIELTPRVGNHQIILGKLDNYKENMEKLKIFYDRGLNEIGWNRYSVINLKFKNQVVCTRRNNN